MGCASSKLDDLPAVALCRERCGFLDEAIQQRYALAEAHIGYMHSLKGIGRSLHNFIEHDLGNSSGSPPSPKLNLPPQRKGDPVVSAAVQAAKSSPKHHHHSHSNSGSHLHFHSESDSDDDSGSLHHSDHSSPLHAPDGHIEYMDEDQDGLGGYPGGFPGGGFMHMNYMKNKATPAVVYQQRPLGPENVHRMDMGESSSSASYYPYPSSNANSNPYPYYGYPNYGGGGGGIVGYYGGGGSPPPYGAMSVQQPAAASSSKPPPPPPSPPRASAWDFLNPFENYDKYYSEYTPSRDSKEVREEEGIPDLEDEDYQHEVVKEVHGDQKFAGDGGKHSKAVADDTEASLYQTRPSVSVENKGGPEYEVPVVEKKVVDDEERSDERPAFKARGGSLNVFEAAREIEVLFQRASECGNEIAEMLEVGKLPYNRKHGIYFLPSIQKKKTFLATLIACA